MSEKYKGFVYPGQVDIEVEKAINELYSKRSANLQQILDNQTTPSRDEILNSRDFQTRLISDLGTGKRNITSWMLKDKIGSMEDLTSTDDDSFYVKYEFSFTYKYNNIPVGLVLFVGGDVDVDWQGNYRSQTRTNPAESPEPIINNSKFGKHFDIALFDDEGTEINMSWLTPDLQQKVIKAISDSFT